MSSEKIYTSFHIKVNRTEVPQTGDYTVKEIIAAVQVASRFFKGFINIFVTGIMIFLQLKWK